jgi:glycine/D-amino acid oxidase-like deaminating enzyme
VPHPVIFDLDGGFSVRCEPSTDRTRLGRIRFTGARELSVDQEPELDPKAREWAREALATRLPMYRDSELMGGQAYRVVLTPDSHPVVGPVHGIEGLYVIAGFSGNDFQLAPSIGEGMAQMILGQPISAFDPEFFSPARFA